MQPDPAAPPVPIAAVIGEDQRFILLTFDKPLMSESLISANWIANVIPPLVADSATVIVPNFVEVMFASRVEAATLTYEAHPADLEGVDGLEVSPFTFPFA